MGPRFKDRAERHELSFPVEFVANGRIITGRCLNLSLSGLLAHFEEPLELWTSGHLRLHIRQRSCSLSGRVVRVDRNLAGIAFSDIANPNSFEGAIIQDVLAELLQIRKHVAPPF